MHKYIMVTLFIVACIVGITFSFAAALDAANQREEPPAANELRIEAYNWEFDQTEYVVPVGETMLVSLRNVEGRHGIEIEGLDIVVMDEPVEVTFDTPGEYRIICNILCGPGHDDMVATLIVQ